MGNRLNIAVIGDFEPGRLSHEATNKALRHGADASGAALDTEWLPTLPLENANEHAKLEKYHGFFCAPGGAYKSMTGALAAIRFAREGRRPYIGT